MTKKKIDETYIVTQLKSKRILVDDIVLVCAFRYALGRRSYITGWISDEIKRCWMKLDNKFQVLIQKEIREAIEEDRAGMSIDVSSWKGILDLKVKEVEDND
jgi:hypothetical protein